MINTRRQPPVSPATLPLVVRTLAEPDVDDAALVAVVAHDQGLAARVLAAASSARPGPAGPVADLAEAVAIVGPAGVHTLAIGAALDPDGVLPGCPGHAVLVATAARLLAPVAGVQPSDAFAAGLLHDLGELLLLQARPAEYASMHGTFQTHHGQLRAEKEAFGTDHALVAAEHLLDWRVPDVIADAVADHHDPFPTSAATTIVVAAADELISAEVGRTRALDLLEVDVAAADGLRHQVEREASAAPGLQAAGRLGT